MRVRTALPFLVLSLWTPSAFAQVSSESAVASKLCLNGLVRVYSKWRSQTPFQSGCVTTNTVATPSSGSNCPSGYWHTRLADPPHTDVCISVLAIILDPEDVPSQLSSLATPLAHAPSQLFSLATPLARAPLRLSSLVTPPAHAPSRSSSLATPANLESRRSLARQKKPWPSICLTSGCNWQMASLQASSVGGAVYMSKSGQANMIQSAQSKRQLVAALEAPFLGRANPNGYIPYSRI